MKHAYVKGFSSWKVGELPGSALPCENCNDTQGVLSGIHVPEKASEVLGISPDTIGGYRLCGHCREAVKEALSDD